MAGQDPPPDQTVVRRSPRKPSAPPTYNVERLSSQSAMLPQHRANNPTRDITQVHATQQRVASQAQPKPGIVGSILSSVASTLSPSKSRQPSITNPPETLAPPKNSPQKRSSPRNDRDTATLGRDDESESESEDQDLPKRISNRKVRRRLNYVDAMTKHLDSNLTQLKNEMYKQFTKNSDAADARDRRIDGLATQVNSLEINISSNHQELLAALSGRPKASPKGKEKAVDMPGRFPDTLSDRSNVTAIHHGKPAWSRPDLIDLTHNNGEGPSYTKTTIYRQPAVENFVEDEADYIDIPPHLRLNPNVREVIPAFIDPVPPTRPRTPITRDGSPLARTRNRPRAVDQPLHPSLFDGSVDPRVTRVVRSGELNEKDFMDWINGIKDRDDALQALIERQAAIHEKHINEMRELYAKAIHSAAYPDLSYAEASKAAADRAAAERAKKTGITVPVTNTNTSAFPLRSAPTGVDVYSKAGDAFPSSKTNTKPPSKAGGGAPPVPPNNTRPVAAAPGDPDDDGDDDDDDEDDGGKGDPDPLKGRDDMYGGRFSSYVPTFYKPAPDADDDKSKLKRDDVGTFNPYADDPDDMGMIESGTTTVYTDATEDIVEQTSLRTTSTDRANRRLINASIYLSGYNLKVFHIPGKLNFVPDALSRLKAVGDDAGNPEGVPVLDNIWEDSAHCLGDISAHYLDDVWYSFSEAQMDPKLRKAYTAAYASDKRFAKVMEYLKQCKKVSEDGDVVFSKPGYPFFMRDGLIYNQQADGTKNLCIPHKFVKNILEAAHDEKHHFGRNRMMYDLQGLSFPNKTGLVRKYIEHCPACQLNQTDRSPPIGDYQPIRPEEALPMRTISIDFVVGLPEVSSADTPWQMPNHNTFNAMMPVTDKTSKRSLLIPGHETYTATEWGIITVRMLLLCDWGFPTGIISDRDRKFTSAYWRGMWTAIGTKLLMTTAHHPPGNGAAERKNQTVEIAIGFHAFCYELGYNWLLVIPSLQWNLNSAFIEGLKASPHEFLFGHKLLGPLDIATDTKDPSHPLKDNPAVRDHIRQEAQLAMDFAIANAKLRHDASHRQVDLEVGDKVFLKLNHGYHLPGRPSRKTSQQRSGPFKIIQKVGRLAYKLDLPPRMKIHPVISVAHLTPAPNDDDPFGRSAPPPGPVEDSQSSDSGSDTEKGPKYELDKITAHKWVNGNILYHVKWKGYGHHENEWQDTRQLKNAKELVEDYWRHRPDERKPGAAHSHVDGQRKVRFVEEKDAKDLRRSPRGK